MLQGSSKCCSPRQARTALPCPARSATAHNAAHRSLAARVAQEAMCSMQVDYLWSCVEQNTFSRAKGQTLTCAASKRGGGSAIEGMLEDSETALAAWRMITEACESHAVSSTDFLDLEEIKDSLVKILVKERLLQPKKISIMSAQKLANLGIPYGVVLTLKEAFPTLVAPQGPVKRNLEQEAGKIQAAGSQFFIQRGENELLFIDPDGNVQKQLKSWLDSRVAPGDEDPPVPLFVNGLIKTGKSFVLEKVLPAVASQHEHFGVGKAGELVVMKLDMNAISSSKDFDLMCVGLLRQLRKQIRRLNIPVPEDVWRQSLEAESKDSQATLTAARELMAMLDPSTHVLVLVDEAQAWMLPRYVDGAENELDLMSARAARGFFRDMLFKTPPNVLWAVTGSGMATFWSSLAMAPKGGSALTVHNRRVDLPCVADEKVKAMTFSAICEQNELILDKSEAKLLYRLFDSLPALMVFLMKEWIGAGRPADVSGFAAVTCGMKLLAETVEDLSVVVQLMEPSQRRALFCMTQRGLGAETSALGATSGLSCWIGPYLVPVAPASKLYYLVSNLHRRLFQMLLTPEGELQALAAVEVPTSGSPTLWEAQRHLFLVSEAISQAKRKKFAGKAIHEDLKTLLVGWAERLENDCGPAAGWVSQGWFQQVLEATANSKGTTDNFRKALLAAEKEKGGMEPFELLAWYHQLLRNCLAHEELEKPPKEESEAAVAGGVSSSIDDDTMSMAEAMTTGFIPLFEATDVSLVYSWPLAGNIQEMMSLLGPVIAKCGRVSSDRGYVSGRTSSSSGSSSSGRLHSRAVRASPTSCVEQPGVEQLQRPVPSWVLSRIGFRKVKFLDTNKLIKGQGQQ